MAIGRTNASVGGGGSQLKAIIDGRKDSSYLFYYFSGTSVNNLISYNDTENSKSMTNMFGNCKNLTSIPLLNTSNVKKMWEMFCSCLKLTSIPLLDTSNVTRMWGMFNNCEKLTTIPQLNTSKVTDMENIFVYCYKLTSIPALDVSNVTTFSRAFDGCYNLESIEMTGMKVSFNISSSTKFTREALVVILNNLATVSTSQTLTMGATNLAKLTEEDKAIATNKGWTLA